MMAFPVLRALILASFVFLSAASAQAQVVVGGAAEADVQTPTAQVTVQSQPPVHAPPAAGAQVAVAAPAAAASADIVIAPPAPRNRLAIDGAFAVPVDDWARAIDFGVGGLLRYEHDVVPQQVSITGRIGYIHNFGPDIDISLVPIMGGAKYRFFPTGPTPFIAGELGLSYAWATVNVDTGFGTVSGSDSDVELAMSLGGGYDLGAVELGASLYLPDADDLVGFMFTAGVDLAEF